MCQNISACQIAIYYGWSFGASCHERTKEQKDVSHANSRAYTDTEVPLPETPSIGYH